MITEWVLAGTFRVTRFRSRSAHPTVARCLSSSKGLRVALPSLTPEQRAAALQRATEARRVRADARDQLRRAGIHLPDVLAGIISRADTDDAIGKMRVTALIESVPGIGKVRAAATMERLGISPSRRVRGLGAHQRAALRREFTVARVESPVD